MRILWILEKQFDVALDTATWIEVLKVLQKSHTIQLVTNYRSEKTQFPELNSEIIYLDSPNVPFLNRFVQYSQQLIRFESLVACFEPDVILFNSFNVSLIKKAGQMQEKYDYRAILDIRTLPVTSSPTRNVIDSYLFGKCLQLAVENFAGVTFITEEMRKYCLEKYSLPQHKSTIWSSGVDPDFFRPEPSAESDLTMRLLYHGTVADNRGLDSAVRAIALLKDINVHLTILGSGNGMKSLQQIVDRERLQNKVTLASPVSYKQVPAQINMIDLGIIPFPDYHGWNVSSPIKLFEYLSCAKPVIVTNISAHINVLTDKDFAFWSDGNSPEALATAIREAFDRRKILDLLGNGARELVLESYTWEKQTERIDNFISSLI